MNVALILAGGNGKRFDANIPKQFVNLKKKPIIVHTLQKFVDCKSIDQIFVVCLANYVDEMKRIINQYSISKVNDIIVGGKTRHESIINGINYLINKGLPEATKIVIHNANMPLVTISNINDCIRKCVDNTVVTTAAQCSGFFYQISSDDSSLLIGPNRDCLLHAKVPEAMYLKVANKIYNDDAFNEVKYESYTAGMLGIIKGLNVELSICDSTNMKITTKEDYKLVETYLENESNNE